jgi:hypothetical protein
VEQAAWAPGPLWTVAEKSPPSPVSIRGPSSPYRVSIPAELSRLTWSSILQYYIKHKRLRYRRRRCVHLMFIQCTKNNDGNISTSKQDDNRDGHEVTHCNGRQNIGTSDSLRARRPRSPLVAVRDVPPPPPTSPSLFSRWLRRAAGPGTVMRGALPAIKHVVCFSFIKIQLDIPLKHVTHVAVPQHTYFRRSSPAYQRTEFTAHFPVSGKLFHI